MYQWAVLGAGPAGIIAVCHLLQSKVPANDILWVDPEFSVGQFGTVWSRVWSNTPMATFHACMQALNIFGDMPCFEFTTLDATASCRLNMLAEPLMWLSNQCKKQVHIKQGIIDHIALSQGQWQLKSNTNRYQAKRVILATGSEPKKLNLPFENIDLAIALNDELLAEQSNTWSNETIGVFGSSHSAILVLENVLNMGVKKVINFYKTPLKYAMSYEDFTLFDNTGLKKHAADWASKNIDGVLPCNLDRMLCSDDRQSEVLSQCTQLVYAIGFDRKASVLVEGYSANMQYNEYNGIIAPGLFGLGIAYPNKKTDAFGYTENNVGVVKFFHHIQRCFPMWQRYVVDP
ncbi:MAG: FAD-dependent oxidoreductase [Endozoicomonadaceae bacterium]|nr:FAD-dependent oxidoreductase [Endozoicomonadaceae bacterium]